MYDGWGEDDPRKMPWHLYLDATLRDYASAVRADITKQNFSVRPRHWYVDTKLWCSRCGESFTFTTSEQRFWYEELSFKVESYAKHCAPCRSVLRRLKSLKQEYNREIGQALARDADRESKRRLLDVLDALDDGGVELPERTREKRRVLRRQLDRATA